MTSTRWAGLVMALLFLPLSWSPVVSAQDLSFTSAQVARGDAAYQEHCASCHGPRMQGEHLSPSLVGARFDRAFRGKSAAVLAFHLRRMPPEPAPTSGRLSDATYANIVAHILGKDGGQLLTSGVGIGPATHPDAADGTIGRVQAIDVENHTLTWMHEQVSAISTGVLATSSGVVFAGDTDPSLKAFDDTTGELLGEYGRDDLPSSSIITYRAGGTQYRVG